MNGTWQNGNKNEKAEVKYFVKLEKFYHCSFWVSKIAVQIHDASGYFVHCFVYMMCMCEL